MEKEKVGFFEQYVIACFRPSKYKELLGRKKGALVGYLLILFLLLGTIEYVIPFAAWNVSVGGIENLITNRFPAFEIKDGTLSIDSPVEIRSGQRIRVIVDSAKETYSDRNLDENYMMELLAGKKNAIIKNNTKVYEISFEELKNITITNDDVLSLIPAFILSMGFSFFAVLAMKAGGYICYAFFLAVLCRTGLKNRTGTVIDFRENFCIALYAGTLYAIVASVNNCLGFVSSFAMMMFGVIVTTQLIFRAEECRLGLDKRR